MADSPDDNDEKYGDIIRLPHFEPKYTRRMSAEDRVHIFGDFLMLEPDSPSDEEEPLEGNGHVGREKGQDTFP